MQHIKVNQKIDASLLIRELELKFPEFKIKTVYFSNNIITIKKDMIMAVIDFKYTDVTIAGKLNRQNLGYLFTFCFCGLFGGFPALIAHYVINNNKKEGYTDLENKILYTIQNKFN